MNGPAHYKEAERLVALADRDDKRRDGLIRFAQVHATLALVAATAETYAEQWSGNHNGREWSEAIS